MGLLANALRLPLKMRNVNKNATSSYEALRIALLHNPIKCNQNRRIEITKVCSATRNYAEPQMLRDNTGATQCYEMLRNLKNRISKVGSATKNYAEPQMLHDGTSATQCYEMLRNLTVGIKINQ